MKGHIKFCNSAKNALEKGNIALCIKFADDAIKLNPNYAESYFIRGKAFYETKQYDRAIEDFTKVIELIPNHRVAYRQRGIVKLLSFDFQGAIDDFEKYFANERIIK